MRPTITPEVLASLTEGAPKRLVRKLDKEPNLAEAWEWSGTAGGAVVLTDKDERVSLTFEGGCVTSVAALACTCLLSPRCLHVLGVASLLELAEGSAAPVSEPAPGAHLAVDDAARSLAEEAWRLGARVLTAGAKGSGPMLIAELLRVVHGARLAGLHRLAAAITRVVRGVRGLRHGRGDLDPRRFSSDLYELLHVSWRLRHGASEPAWRGTARRVYEDVGSLRLHGVLSEAVATRSGYAGVSTMLIDDDGRLWSIADVRAGEGERARGAYASSVDIGGCTLTHRELGRAGLFVTHGRGSADGRLGSGQQVHATRAEPRSLFDTPFAARFEESLDGQCDRAFEQSGRLGDDLLALRGTVLGLADGDLIALVAPSADVDEAAWQPMRFVAPHHHPALHYLGNLEQLAHAPGLRLGFIARARLQLPRTAELLAVVATAESRALALPDAWHGRCNLGVDRLRSDYLPTAGRTAVTVEVRDMASPDPLAALLRRLHRMALGGHSTITTSASREIRREAARLDARLLTTGAKLLIQLTEATLDRGHSLSGQRAAVSSGEVARAWLAAMRYQRAANRSVHRDAWGTRREP